MSNRWICTVAMLVPEAARTNTATMASMMSGNQLDNTPDFFTVPVCPIGTAIPTHFLAHSRMRESVLLALPNLLVYFPGAAYYVTNHDDDGASALNVEEWLSSFGLETLKEEV